MYDQALQQVVAEHAWPHVVNHIDMLPRVGELHPNEWTQALTVRERALLAQVFSAFDEAAQRVDNIDPDINVSDSEQAALINDYIGAREKLDATVDQVVTLVTNAVSNAYHSPRQYDPGGSSAPQCQHQANLHESLQVMQNLVATAMAGIPVVRRRTRRRKVVDICSGQQSLARFLLMVDAGAEVLSIDIISREEALAEVPAHLRHRIHHVQLDLSHQPLSISLLQELVKRHLRCDLHELYHVHFSPCCKSYSTAQGKYNTHSYRTHNGEPNPKVGMVKGKRNEFMYQYAIMWDAIVAATLNTCVHLTRQHPDVLITAENPVGAWQLHPLVKQLQGSPEWRLLEVDYCKTTDADLDGGKVFTQKPTHVLAYGVRGSSFFQLPKCQKDCPFMLTSRDGKARFHSRAIRIDDKSPPGQLRQLGSMRHAIPCGLFLALHDEHERWLVSRLPTDASRIVLSSRIHSDLITEANELVSSEHTHVGRKPPTVTTAPDQAFTSQLSRFQKLYLLLHFRFGHASLKRLKALVPFAKILTKAHKVECPICHMAKATKKPHIGKLRRMTYALALVVFDIQGPFRTPDLDGNLYNLVLVDDHTDFKWLYRLRSKDQLGATLRLWMAMLGVCPERLRHDGAGENLGTNGINSVAQVCYERCIFPERTVPYNPQQLSRVERVNRTFLEAARCLLLTTPGASDDLWGYAFLHACYLDQFLGSDSLQDCPYKRWHGKHPPPALLNNIRTWGSIVVFSHNEDRHKLQMPGHRGMFLGYCPVSDGVFIRDLDNERKPVRITRDVLARSFSEVAHLVREPVGVTMDEYQMLENELPRVEGSEPPATNWEAILLNNCEPVAQELQQYYRSFQAFSKDRRMLLSQDPSQFPQSIETSIKEEWRKTQVGRAKIEQSRRQAAQALQDVQHAVQRKISTHEPEAVSDPTHAVDTSDISDRVAPIPARRSLRLASDAFFNSDCQPPAKRAKVSADSAADASSSSAASSSTRDAQPGSNAYRPDRFAHTDIDNIRCESCGDHRPHAQSPMIICDGCNKGYHTRCAKISVMPAAEDDWLCHKCIQPGMRIAVFMKRDKQWHHGTVRAQHAQSIGTEVAYDNGSRALENLNALKWRPLYENALYATLIALAEAQPHEDLSHLNIWLSTTPRSIAHLSKFPTKVQELWHRSRLKEFKSIVAKEAVEIVDRDQLPSNAIVLPAAWVFKIKGDGTFKSRLVLLGHLMPKNDEVDVSSPTPRLASVRLVLALAIKIDLAVELADIDTAFTYASPSTTIYASIPGGLYIDGRLKGKFMHLLKNLYGAAEAPRMFHNLLHNWFVADGFTVNPHEPCLYIKWIGSTPLLALVHVDDCILVGAQDQLNDLKTRIKVTFSLKELGPLGLDPSGAPSMVLGLEVRRTDDEFQLRQTKLIDVLVTKAGNELHNIPHEKVPIRDLRLDSSSSPHTAEERSKWRTRPFRSLLGIVGYLMLASRMDCAFAYQALARFNDSYGQDHWTALLALVMYLKKSRDSFYLCISKHGGMRLCGYCDSDWNGSEFCKSSTGWIIFFGNTPISWVSRLQRVTARSTGEAEFYALSSIAQEAVYLQMLVQSLQVPSSAFEIFCNDKSRYQDCSDRPKQLFDTAVKIWSDSKVALAQASKPDNWVVDKLRHIRTAYFFFKSYVRSAQLELCSCSGIDNPADIFTKGFGAPGKTAANQKADLFQRHANFCSGRHM